MHQLDSSHPSGVGWFSVGERLTVFSIRHCRYVFKGKSVARLYYAQQKEANRQSKKRSAEPSLLRSLMEVVVASPWTMRDYDR